VEKGFILQKTKASHSLRELNISKILTRGREINAWSKVKHSAFEPRVRQSAKITNNTEDDHCVQSPISGTDLLRVFVKGTEISLLTERFCKGRYIPWWVSQLRGKEFQIPLRNEYLSNWVHRFTNITLPPEIVGITR
jgi:hypothetical protein